MVVYNFRDKIKGFVLIGALINGKSFFTKKNQEPRPKAQGSVRYASQKSSCKLAVETQPRVK